jgi:hypothetical protein
MEKMSRKIKPQRNTTGPFAWLLGATLSLVLAGAAWAKLGGDLASIQSDTQAFAASTRQSTLPAATLFTQTLPSGLVVRQYLDANGAVFAVAWEGPVLPDFERLLGAHYPTYLEAVRLQRRGVNVQGPALVIESGGMMRAFSGRAYLPGLLPRQLSAQDIR